MKTLQRKKPLLVLVLFFSVLSLFLLPGCKDTPSVKGIDSITITSAGDYLFEGSLLTARIQPSGAVVTYQWLRSKGAVPDGEYETIPDATAKTYTVTSEDIGKYIKVIVTRFMGVGIGQFSSTSVTEATTKHAVAIAELSTDIGIDSEEFATYFDTTSGTLTLKEDLPNQDVTIPEGLQLIIPSGKTLTVAGGKSLTNKGTIVVEDGGSLTVEKDGTLNIDGGSVAVDDTGAFSIEGIVKLEDDAILQLGSKSLEALGSTGKIILDSPTATLKSGTENLRWYTLGDDASAEYTKPAGTLTLDFTTTNGDGADVTIRREGTITPSEVITVNANVTLVIEKGELVMPSSASSWIKGTVQLEGNSTLKLPDNGVSNSLASTGSIILSSPKAKVTEDDKDIRWYVLGDEANAEYTKPTSGVKLGFTADSGGDSSVTTRGEGTIEPSEVVTVESNVKLLLKEGELDMTATGLPSIKGTVKIEGSATLKLPAGGVSNSLTSTGSIILSSPDAVLMENNGDIRWYVLGDEANAVYTKPSVVNLGFIANDGDVSFVTIRREEEVTPSELVKVNEGITFIIEEGKGLKTTANNRFVVEGSVLLENGSSLNINDAWLNWGAGTNGKITADVGSTVKLNNSDYLGGASAQWSLGGDAQAIINYSEKRAIEFASESNGKVTMNTPRELKEEEDFLTLSGDIEATLDSDLAIIGVAMEMKDSAVLIVPKDVTLTRATGTWFSDLITSSDSYVEIRGGRALLNDDGLSWFGPGASYFMLDDGASAKLLRSGFIFTLRPNRTQGIVTTGTTKNSNGQTFFPVIGSYVTVESGVAFIVGSTYVSANLDILDGASLTINSGKTMAIRAYVYKDADENIIDIDRRTASVKSGAILNIIGDIVEISSKYSGGVLSIESGATVSVDDTPITKTNYDTAFKPKIDNNHTLAGTWVDEMTSP